MSTAEATTAPEEHVSKLRKAFHLIGWSLFFLVLLITFTLLKMPQDKIHRWVIGTVNQQLAPMGMQLMADEGSIGFGPALQYEMTGIKVTKSADNKILMLSKFTVSPAFRGLLEGKFGADFKVEEGAGLIEGSFFIKGEDFDTSILLQGLNFGRMGALPFFTGLEGTLELRGNVDLRGNQKSLSAFEGMTKLTLSRIRLDEQSFMGFKIPQVNIADGAINLSIANGRVNLTDVHLGKIGGADDLQILAGGGIKLGKMAYDSVFDLKVRLGLSKPLLSSFSLIDMILGPMKQPDGTYAFKYAGDMNSAKPEIDPSP